MMAGRDDHEMIWETALPLFSRRMFSQWTGAMLATGLVMMGLMSVIFVAGGDWDMLPPMLLLSGGATAAIWAVGWVVMAVVFRGKYHVRFTLSDRGLRCDTIDRAARAGNRLAVVLGLLMRRPGLAGAGLIGASRESESVKWSGAFRAVYDAARFTILLRNSWRSLMWVQCTPENYETVAAAMARHMREHRTDERVAGRSPLWRSLGRTGLVVLAVFPLFAVADEFDAGPLLPILILCFALATVWLINLFGWVVIAGLVLLTGQVIASQFEVRQSIFRRGETYRAYEVLSDSDYALLALAAASAAVLVWLSVRALRGRWLSALLEGFKDMEGE